MGENFEEMIDPSLETAQTFSYSIGLANGFAHTEYKVLLSQAEGLFVPCFQLKWNGKTNLCFLKEGLLPVLEVLPSLDYKQALQIVLDFLERVISIKNNGFLKLTNVDFNLKRIFIDPKTYKTVLTYIPVNNPKNSFVESNKDIREVVTYILSKNSKVQSLASSAFFSELADPSASLELLTGRIRNFISSNFQGPTLNNKARGIQVKLQTLNSPVPAVMIVNKNSYVLGRKRELCDGVIDFNPMIGRTHCKIVNENATYFIQDLNSRNGTYLNRQRLLPNQKFPLKDGDILTLANSDFKISFE